MVLKISPLAQKRKRKHWIEREIKSCKRGSQTGSIRQGRKIKTYKTV
jgi:hypothetical protein